MQQQDGVTVDTARDLTTLRKCGYLCPHVNVAACEKTDTLP
ncbi:hypothetical protein [Nostoc sp.]